MELICNKRCIIGEGPIWNEKEKLLFFVNGVGKEICTLDLETSELNVYPSGAPTAAIAFDTDYRPIFSREDGIFRYENGELVPLYDRSIYNLERCNDMKVGPDGCIYVGNESSKRHGVSNDLDGKLYRIDTKGNVKVLLDGLILSNGMDWSMDGTRFYHTDSDTHTIREYDFDKESGNIHFTGRQVSVHGVDGFTIDSEDRLYVACWGHSRIAVIDTEKMEIERSIELPVKRPASCGFAGENMGTFIVVSASYGADVEKEPLEGMTFKANVGAKGRKPYLFGQK